MHCKINKCLYFFQDFNVPNIGKVIGFGNTKEDSSFKSSFPKSSFSKSNCIMREANVTIYTKEECRKTENPLSFNTDDTLCAGDIAGGIDSCQVSK